ncbi:hypothetical protein J1G42_14395 [Cellulomonas sp. zg-ZUI222]|uniref:hypothetical protein n=1 Tax=Cellulomonas TaxID=1707 RepID=UPI001A94D797|nr:MULTISPECIES: hypothetical protein [Cellulomonas]MBO0901774.1 hypothetical protein [Cellulomonas sp. zg-ZUI22]MBO0922011.1 hypothetical protein [Cellulomonas wangleii]
MGSHGDWLARYRGGAHREVWRELGDLGHRVREPEYAPEAQAVCDEWARRVRINLERIIDRLSDQGYRFHENDDAQTPAVPFAPASAGAAEHVRWLEQTFGTIPMTLSSWVRLVGDVWLVGTHPRWAGASAADPLVLEVEGTRYAGADMRALLLDELDQWEDTADGERFQLPVAPDALHKDNVSGGPPYGVVLPDAAADGRIVTTDEMALVDYVRLVFDRGGFAGCSEQDRRGAVITSLGADLLPL